ncbi:unnamed protein product [Mytilus coruscus]|uniref:Uncharacterized protein n=1 Tax=Mytilus coruscus TaxID=42192 RepID=A0A6J8EVP5_MYTCO|nr:unnamed protein product [Mytilus coruscus]
MKGHIRSELLAVKRKLRDEKPNKTNEAPKIDELKELIKSFSNGVGKMTEKLDQVNTRETRVLDNCRKFALSDANIWKSKNNVPIFMTIFARTVSNELHEGIRNLLEEIDLGIKEEKLDEFAFSLFLRNWKSHIFQARAKFEIEAYLDSIAISG